MDWKAILLYGLLCFIAWSLSRIADELRDLRNTIDKEILDRAIGR
jgi:hypothetical protein